MEGQLGTEASSGREIGLDQRCNPNCSSFVLRTEVVAQLQGCLVATPAAYETQFLKIMQMTQRVSFDSKVSHH